MNVTLDGDRLSYDCAVCADPAVRLQLRGGSGRWVAWCAACLPSRSEHVELPVHLVQSLSQLLSASAAYRQRHGRR